MEKFERLDFEGPKKEFIKNNIQFVLDQSSSEQKNEYIPQISHNQDLKYSHNKYIRIFYRVVLKNDPDKIDRFIRKITGILDRYPGIKKRLKARLMPKPQDQETNRIISLQHLLYLDVNNFILQMYIEMLGREADNEGFNNWQRAVCSSMPKEAVIYAVSKTKEFGNRFEIENIDEYKRVYSKYRIKKFIKKIPIISYLIKLMTIPVRIEQLVITQNIRNENLLFKFNKMFESTIHRINEIQAFNYQFFCDYIKNNDIYDRENIESLLKRIDKCRDENNEYLDSAVKKLDEGVNNIYNSLIQRINELQLNNEKLSGVVEAYSDILEVHSNDLKSKIKVMNEKEDVISADIETLTRNVETYNKSVCSKLDLYGSQKPCNPVFDPKYELHILKKSNIPLLEKLVSQSNSHYLSKTVVVGHYAREVYEDISKACEISFLKPASFESVVLSSKANDNTLVLPEYLHQFIEKTDRIIILNPAVAMMLIMEDLISGLALKVKEELILCFDTNADNEISVVWGSGFSGIEQSPNGVYHRWFQSAFPAGTIHLFNNTVYNQKCIAEFTIRALDNKSQMVIYAGNEKYSYKMEEGFLQVVLELNLKPGVNNISMEYFGKTVQPGEDPRFLKFAVSGFGIISSEDNFQQFSVSGANAYKNQNDVGMFSQNPGDEMIRSSLHNNGFFEVESLICSRRNDKMITNGLSRYCEASQAYEFLESQHRPQESESITVYIARRKGRYNSDSK